MAKKPVLTDINSGFASSTQLNGNNTAIEEAFENTLSRDGSTPNSMEADFDMNGNDVLNVGDLRVNKINGKIPLDTVLTGTFDPLPRTDSFSTGGSIYVLSETPISKDYVDIWVDGVHQNPSTYSLPGNFISFNTAVPSNISEVLVKYSYTT